MDIESLAKKAGMVTELQSGAASCVWSEGLTAVSADDLERFAGLVAAEERKACAACVPTNWCDPMLTGPKAVVGEVADCRSIEAVLNATRARIMERSNAEFTGRVSGPVE